MKKFVILTLALLAFGSTNAQLVIYSNFNLQGTSGNCVARTIYTDASIPNGLNDGIKSIALTQGYMATLAENADGSGERFSYMATISNLNVNLAMVLQNKVSFIRVLPLPSTPVKKKGAGATNNTERDALNVSWFYDWGFNDVSTATQDYSPMLWGAYASIETSVTAVVNKTNVTHFLAFNEPDNTGQSGSSGGVMADDATRAIPYYKKMLRAGQRMGSPATTESQYRVWLTNFTNEAEAQNLKIDVVCVHWYDWGNITGSNPDNNVTNIFNRFKNYITAVYNLYQKPIWITEFNANINRTSTIHEQFMALALPWLDADPRVERYAYFFGNDIPARNTDGTLTAAGQIYSNHTSVNAYPENVYDKRPSAATTVLVSWEASGQLQGGRSIANFSPTFLNGNMTAPTALTRGSGVVLPTTAASNGYWGGNEWSTTTAATGVSANKFLKFSLKANQTVSYQSIDKFNIRISNTGPIQYQIDYQIDNGAFVPCATVTGATRTTANFTLGPIDLSSISGLQGVTSDKTVTFRITPFDASGTGSFLFGSGTADTDADLSITGSFADNLVVPITLSDFTSNRVKNQVVLTWKTQSEFNFSHFALERSTDGKTFYEIAKINGSNQLIGNKYDYTDTPEPTTNYYRLKIMDSDGSFVYSKILAETFNDFDVPFMVYPNISKDNSIQTTFKNVSKTAQIKVVNVNGQVLSTYNLQEETSTQTIEIAHFTEGVYFLILQDKGRFQTVKFIKQ
ncbi:MAG: T9SS type A sorting domain-containing protein [Saprospiraceae bacterium]|nr:T9SS type A sorting domain-containing protein [Saprospiraceae bacterium]